MELVLFRVGMCEWVLINNWEGTMCTMFSDWTSADYFSNIASLVVFVIAYWLGRQ